MDNLLNLFNAAVDSIYESALDPHNWPNSVRRIADLHGVSMANLLTPTTSTLSGGFAFPIGMPESTLELWATKFVGHDVWVRHTVSKGWYEQGRVVLGSQILTDDEFEQSYFYQGLLKQLNLAFLLGNRL